MDISHVFILSFVEGVTEFLPVSSTAHLILTSHLLGIPQDDFLEVFQITIQLGAIGAVAVLYFDKIWKNKTLFYKACIGFIPTGLLGVIFLKQIKVLLASPIVPVISLLIGGIAIILIEIYFSKRYKTDPKREKSLKVLTYKDALLVGLIQSISMIPGVSRAASSTFGAMLLKFDRQSAVDFSFLLAIPTMLIATGYDLFKTSPTLTADEYAVIFLGTILSFFAAILIIKWLIKYVQTNSFIPFGIYRIVVSIVYYFLFLR